MKILVITDLYPISEDERFTPMTIHNFVKIWKNQGHDVRILKPNFLLNSFLRKKPFYKTGFYGDIENVNYFFPFLGDIKQKIKTLRNFTPDIIIAHMPSGLICANKLGIPFIAGVHVSDLEVLTNPIYSIYFKTELEKAYKNACKIACRSEVLKKKFLKLYPQYTEKTFVCFSGINKDIIVKKEWKNTRKVLTCAHLIKRKNVDKVIKECANADVFLTIIGDGEELNNLKLLAEKLNYKNIKFTGQLNHEKVLKEMQNSDIFVLPSINETFGMVYLEAMASGCITICSENEGIDGIIKDGFNGYYYREGIINEIYNSNNQNLILENTYNTILNYTEEKAGENYLSNILKS